MSPALPPVERILLILRSIPGAHRVMQLNDAQRRTAVELEELHEKASVIPIHNLGVRLLAERSLCFAVLKDATFRSPRVPTVYLVEEGAADDCTHVLAVAGKRYAIVGEEVVGGRQPYSELTIPLESSFVIFPGRRRGPEVPCVFLLPPIIFPELEQESALLGIRDIVSISPSLSTDAHLRASFDFPPTSDLATILIGCTPVGETGVDRRSFA